MPKGHVVTVPQLVWQKLQLDYETVILIWVLALRHCLPATSIPNCVTFEGVIWCSDDRCWWLLLKAEESLGELEAWSKITLHWSADEQLSSDSSQPRRVGAGQAESCSHLPDFIDRDACPCRHAWWQASGYSVASCRSRCTTNAWYSCWLCKIVVEWLIVLTFNG